MKFSQMVWAPFHIYLSGQICLLRVRERKQTVRDCDRQSEKDRDYASVKMSQCMCVCIHRCVKVERGGWNLKEHKFGAISVCLERIAGGFGGCVGTSTSFHSWVLLERGLEVNGRHFMLCFTHLVMLFIFFHSYPIATWFSWGLQWIQNRQHWAWMVDVMPVHYREPSINAFTPRGNSQWPVHLLTCFVEIGKKRKCRRKPSQTHKEHYSTHSVTWPQDQEVELLGSKSTRCSAMLPAVNTIISIKLAVLNACCTEQSFNPLEIRPPC